MSRKVYDDMIDGTYVEPGHDVSSMTTERERALAVEATKKAEAFIDRTWGICDPKPYKDALADFIYELMRENEALRKQVDGFARTYSDAEYGKSHDH